MSAAARDVFDIAPINPALEDRKVPQIYQAMVDIMRDTAAIDKSSRNQQQGFNYRGIDSVYNVLHGVLAKHGVFMTSEILDKSREERTNQKGTVLAFTSLRMKYTFWAQDGSNISTTVEGEGMDSGDKSSNKAMAIAHKYALLQAFLIPTEEIRDPDAESHEVAPQQSVRVLPPRPAEHDEEVISPAQHKRLEARLAELKSLNREWVREWLLIHAGGEDVHLNQMSKTLYAELDSKLEDWASVESVIQSLGADRERAIAWVKTATQGHVQHLADLSQTQRDKLADKLATMEKREASA